MAGSLLHSPEWVKSFFARWKIWIEIEMYENGVSHQLCLQSSRMFCINHDVG